ncbi:MAG: hypothetical protein ACYDEV_15170 [Acidiferrobacter sp.]
MLPIRACSLANFPFARKRSLRLGTQIHTGRAADNAGRALVFGLRPARTVPGLDSDGDEPAVSPTGARSRHDLVSEAQRLVQAHPTEMRDAYARSADVELVVGGGEAVVHTLLAEPRDRARPAQVRLLAQGRL